MPKTIDVLFAAEMKRDYGCSAWFLRAHGKTMGGYGKPVRWHRDEVEIYLRGLAAAARHKRDEAARQKEADASRLSAAIDGVRSRTVVPLDAGRIPQGGKGRQFGRRTA